MADKAPLVLTNGYIHRLAAGDTLTHDSLRNALLLARVQTADDTPTSLVLDGGSMTMPEDSVWSIRVLASAILDDGSEGAGYEMYAVYRRDGAAAPTGVGSTAVTVLGEDTPAWAAELSLSSNDVIVEVTGETSHTIDWVARIEIVKVEL